MIEDDMLIRETPIRERNVYVIFRKDCISPKKNFWLVIMFGY
jgi:hypothetical protein